MKLTQEQIEEIRKRAEAATIGDWDYDVEDFEISNGNFMVLQGEVRESNGVTYAAIKAKESDLRFICDAREDIPALLAHIAELENEVQRLTRNGAILIRAALGNPSQEDIDHLVAHLEYETKCRELNGKGDANAES